MTDNRVVDNVQKWYVQPMMKIYEDIIELFEYQNMIVAAIDIMSRDETLPSVMGRDKSDMKRLKGLLTIAKQEKETNFEKVRRDGVMLLFSKFESGIKGLIKNVFIHAPALFEEEIIKGMKIPYVEYRRYSDDELGDIFLADFEKLFLKDKYGFERFESMLQSIGFGSTQEWNKIHKKSLLELSMIRNLLVHKNGVVDKQFKNVCGYLPFEIGDNIKIDEVMTTKYADAVTEYLSEIIRRMDEKIDGYKLLVGDSEIVNANVE